MPEGGVLGGMRAYALLLAHTLLHTDPSRFSCAVSWARALCHSLPRCEHNHVRAKAPRCVLWIVFAVARVSDQIQPNASRMVVVVVVVVVCGVWCVVCGVWYVVGAG